MAEMPRVAVLGCGHWGRNIVRNARALGALAAVVDPSEDGRLRAEKIAAGVPIYPRPDPVLGDPSVTAVLIATPPETHFSLAARAIAAGKDVFVEKPMTTDLRQARELVARAEAGGRILMEGHVLEYHPAVRKVCALVHDGELGEVRYLVSNRLNPGRIGVEENALWCFAPHDVSLILRLVGQRPLEVVATGGCYLQPGRVDVAVAQLLFAHGVRAHAFVSWLHPFKEQKLVVIGSRKTATFDDVTKELAVADLRVGVDEGLPIPVEAPSELVPFGDAEPLREEVAHFLDCVARRRTPLSDGRNALRVLEVLLAAQRSLAAHGVPEPLASGTCGRNPGFHPHARLRPVPAS